jgi:hypothetical protein
MTTVPHDTDPDRPDAAPGPTDPDTAAVPETAVPPGEEPAATCPYCSRPFRDGGRCALHVGARHPERCTEAEQAAYESAREAEGDELFTYHLGVIAALGVVYALLVLAYMVVLS